MRILIADDEPAQARLLQTYLQQHGHQPTLVLDGAQALERAQAEKFDVIILDVMMPYMNGFEVLQKLREDDSMQGVLIIMLTAERETEDIVAGYSKGANVYLTKPIDPATVLKLIES